MASENSKTGLIAARVGRHGVGGMLCRAARAAGSREIGGA